MKYIVLIVIIIASNLNSMMPGPKSAFDQQNQAAQTAIHLRNAGFLIPEHVLFQMHPNARQVWMEYNQKLTELYKAQQGK